ncbi:TRAP-type C4-dicarboxylate transport system permease small subunit [Hoeflea marina]|uniref:TRAP transporter small permease protein n=1 Tax=Hoeflea marina TaxID=274592 RepID=A0A317PC99_9HYPH|nr:TRAP transporter small permease [Hoeflea marina]PWV95774.1 TRAP-type C4-dicarboxylate transport system permease small subunit [Hoeflea marina]
MSGPHSLFFRLGRLLSRTLDATQVIAAILVMAMMLHVVLDVVLKYAISNGFPATVEIVSNYYLVGLAFLPLALAEKQNAHISVEVVTSILPLPVQRGLLVLAWILSIITYSVLAHQTFLDALEKQRIGAFIFSQGVRLFTWPCYFMLPIGFGLMVLALVYRLLALFRPGSDGLGAADPLYTSPEHYHD